MVKKYVKKPVVIDAVQWTGENFGEVAVFLDTHFTFEEHDGSVKTFVIRTLEGDHRADIGDYIIRGIKGEYYPCKPDIFTETYDEYKE